MTQWEAIAVIVSSWAAVLALLEGWWRRRRDRRDDTQEAAHRIEERLMRLEIDQFGSNHNGLRQKVNELDGKIDSLHESLAEMRGELRARNK